MKAILEFNLPEEREEHELALKGNVLAIAINDVLNDVFRSRIKYENFSTNDKLEKLYQSNPNLVMDVIEHIRDDVIKVLEENDILGLV